MSSKDKENTLSKIRQFFRTSKATGNTIKERDLWSEIEKELRPETPITQRCKTLKDLGDLVLTTRLEDATVIKFCDLTKDLIDNKSTEHRHITLTFYCKLIKGQYKNLSIMREYFFRIIQKHSPPEDTELRLELLIALTDCGKTITNFEEKIGKFMIEWFDLIVKCGLTGKYLDILVNLVKFNASHLENDIIVGIVQQSCALCCNIEDEEIGLKCLQVIDTVICYTIFPNETLVLCIVTLCRTVNATHYCTMSWKVMKNLLGTNLGHSSLLTMCNILKDRNYHDDEFLLRGAVFHINMGLWGFKCPVASILKISTSTALDSFLHALDSQKMLVTYEVILSLQMMLPKYGKELPEHVWDVVCNILFAISHNILFHESIGLKKNFICQLKVHFHDVIDTIEHMLQEDHILANINTIYDLIENLADERSELSVLNLIEYRSKEVNATKPQWLQLLHDFIKRFYNISNTKIRCKIIYKLIQIMNDNRSTYEEEILEKIVISQFSNNFLNENDLHVRIAISKALIDFSCHCDTKRCGDLLDILDNLLNRPYDLYNNNDGFIFDNNNDIQDIVVIIDGLIEIFIIKLYRLPSCHAVQIYDMLISYLDKHYQKPKIFEQFNIIREKIFNWLLELRANGTYHIGYPDPANSGSIRYSHYLSIDSSPNIPNSGSGSGSICGITTQQHSQSITQMNLETVTIGNLSTISIRRAFKVIELCLELERDYYVFQSVLKKLPKILQNKALIQYIDIESFANVLFKIRDRKYIDSSFSLKPTSDDYNSLILPVICNLVIYNQSLSPSRHTLIIEELKVGIPSRIANICINTLTIMILEMPETLMRKLPEVLWEMSKMTDTINVAIPVLEFLSILSRLPNNLFVNFISNQYMYVFVISLPYTNPLRYDHYTVSLAHHVIAGWFLKCKLALRKNFVDYIIKSIQSNTRQPFEDDKIPRNEFSPVNEDSSNRKRSSSLTERGSRVRDHRSGITPQSPNVDLRPLMNENLRNFHAELAETCIDFLVRHTYSPCSSLPKRLATAEYLFKDGPSQTWLVGHNLITITTSGCSSPPTRNGLCERCYQLCKTNSTSISNSTYPPNSPEISTGGLSQKIDLQPEFPTNIGNITMIGNITNKRYTKASLQSSSGTESGSTDLTSAASTSSSQQQTLQQQQTTQNSSIDSQQRTTMRQTSNEGRLSSSSSSLEALSRRGSNPDSTENKEGSIGSLLGSTLNQAIASPQLQIQQQICARSCTGWAEIFIRRPTGCLSWIMRIQNPIANDCLGNDLPLNDLIGLFLPTQCGGVFGPNFESSDSQLLSPSLAAQASVVTSEQKRTSDEVRKCQIIEQEAARVVAKVRALKRQEEITSVSGSGPIDIPKKSKCHKEPAGSFSDIDPEDEDVAFEDDDSRSRNPVRRVNSSPEMSSSWRNPFLVNKPSGGGGGGVGSGTGGKSGENSQNPSSENITVATTTSQVTTIEKEDLSFLESEQQQKKKGFSKDMRVSCEAIPEEIAGSTPPSQAESLQDGNEQPQKLNNSDQKSKLHDTEKDSILPPKQHSADDVSTQPNNAVTTSASTTSLKIPIDLQKITAKPPASPTPLSPRLMTKNSANSNEGNINNNINNNANGNGGDMPRGRAKTISVVREVNRNNNHRSSTNSFRPRGVPPPVTNSRLGINPSFIFLQLYNTGQIQVTETPIKVTPENMTAITLLDLIPPFETHKIGVLYVGPGQCNNETEILRNRFGSMRYVNFLKSLGQLVSLKDAKENNIFVNMETNGRDGNFTYVWKDDIVQVTFHVATLMPNHEKDPNCNEKKKHIGNDYVSIVYNESGEEYNLNTIKGQFNYACVVVQPLELNSNRIFVRAKKEIAEYVCPPEPKIVSNSSAPLLARQLALHANLASHVSQSLKTKNPYASNWLERLRKIKNLRAKLLKEIQASNLEREREPPTDSSGSASSAGDVSKIQRQNINFIKYTG